MKLAQSWRPTGHQTTIAKIRNFTIMVRKYITMLCHKFEIGANPLLLSIAPAFGMNYYKFHFTTMTMTKCKHTYCFMD